MKPVGACSVLFFCFGLATGSLEESVSGGDRRAMDSEIGRIVANEMKNGGSFTGEFCELVCGKLGSRLGAWLEKRLRVRAKDGRVEYRCCLSNINGLQELSAEMPAPHLDDLRAGLGFSLEETRYVEVLLAMSMCRLCCSDRERLVLVVCSDQFPKIAKGGFLASNTIRILGGPVEYDLGVVIECSNGRWWDGYLPSFRVKAADKEGSQGIDLLIALERNLGRWAKRAESCGAKRSTDKDNPRTSTVALHLTRKELHRDGYYRLSMRLGGRSALTSVLFYNAYWDHSALLKPLAKWLQAQTTEEERVGFSSAEIDGQYIEQTNVDNCECYNKRCVRLYDGRSWMVVLLVKNDGKGNSFSGDGTLLEGTLERVE